MNNYPRFLKLNLIKFSYTRIRLGNGLSDCTPVNTHFKNKFGGHYAGGKNGLKPFLIKKCSHHPVFYP